MTITDASLNSVQNEDIQPTFATPAMKAIDRHSEPAHFAISAQAEIGQTVTRDTRSWSETPDPRQSYTLPPPAAVDHNRVKVRGLKRWDGEVINVADRFFTAILNPIDHEGMVLQADFELEDLSDADRATIQAGDALYVTSRSIVAGIGRVERTVALKLRRKAVWTAEEVARIDAQASAMSADLADLAE